MSYCYCSRCDHELHVHVSNYSPECSCRDCSPKGI